MAQIGRKFTDAADSEAAAAKGDRRSGVIIDGALYTAYIEQYHQAQRLSLALQTVIDDGEHKLVMEEARHKGYNLPDEDAFRRELETYRNFLNSFNPYDVRMARDGRVRVPMRTARSLYFMAEYNRALSEFVLASVLRTEYLRRFTDLKRAGFPYAGPTALQESADLLMAYGRTAREEASQRRRRDWPRFDM